MSLSTRLIVWRHGHTEWNGEDRIQGHTNIELSRVGRGQARVASAELAQYAPRVIVSSDLARARQTAAALAARTGLPIRTDARLRERDYGDWQGLTAEEVAARWPDEYARWRSGQRVGACGVEDVADVAKRAAAAMAEAAHQAPGGVAIVVTHGGAARHGSATLLGWPPELARTLGTLVNCGWTELHLDPVRGWLLAAHNIVAPTALRGATTPAAGSPLPAATLDGFAATIPEAGTQVAGQSWAATTEGDQIGAPTERS